MDENEVVARGTERLDKLEDDIQQGRQHLKEMTHVGEPYLYEDDERTDAEREAAGQPPPADADTERPQGESGRPPPDVDEAADKEAQREGVAGDADAPPPPG